MIKSFKDKASEKLFLATTIAESPKQFRNIAKRAWIKLEILDAVVNSKVLEEFLGKKNYEHLRGDRKGQDAIKINDQYRICFRWGKDNNVYDVEVNKHYWD
ncbi:MAG: type II toxin-antitoxin system RelE/ParE family toxin [Candidatus Moeniiplasma glomeromycotorum]|nr:type II toxin-antitoxin system RelE/ParE family toxin [Candidatus Moeniiplasma glomeromycotorum]MCE8167015.1 type II toxin-antitoxin system RelE/ParE family toxin [Candidatus Moeniiplasma glomeromycotorum]MCE8168973.1 type II toxin-antitoxin system RelE/ParE family toxin [Candidatus Moeniiplasma glomeromycotorum]